MSVTAYVREPGMGCNVRKRTSRRRKIVLGSAFIISSALMIFLFVRFPVKTSIVTGIVLFLLLVLTYVTHPVMVEEATGGGQS
jgi:hypothetical protein